MDPISYNPWLSPDSTLSIDTRTPTESPKESPQLSPGAESRPLSPEKPKQHESSPELSHHQPYSAVTSPNETEQCESGPWPYSRPSLSANTQPVESDSSESGLEIPFQTSPSNETAGAPASALSILFRGHSTAQNSLVSSPEGKASQCANIGPIFSDAYTANAEAYQKSEVMSPAPRAGRLESVHRPIAGAAQPRSPRRNNIRSQNQTSPQAVLQYTILRRPRHQDSDDIGIEKECTRELKPLPLPKDIPSTTSLVALGSPVEGPKNPVDQIQYSVRTLKRGPIYFPRIPNDVLLGTHFTAAAYNGVESSLAVQLPPQVIDVADFIEDPGQTLSTVDAQALALDSLSIYDFPDWKPRNDYRTWRMLPHDPGQPVWARSDRRIGYRDCTREQLAWIEMMCSTFGAWAETGSMMKYEKLSKEDIAKMFYEKFDSEIPEDWTHLADHLGKGIVKMLCYRQGLIL